MLEVLIGILIATTIVQTAVGWYYHAKGLENNQKHLSLSESWNEVKKAQRINEENKSWLGNWENELQEREKSFLASAEGLLKKKSDNTVNTKASEKSVNGKKTRKLVTKKKAVKKKSMNKTMKKKSSKRKAKK